jgi:hypothetical protein
MPVEPVVPTIKAISPVTLSIASSVKFKAGPWWASALATRFITSPIASAGSTEITERDRLLEFAEISIARVGYRLQGRVEES